MPEKNAPQKNSIVSSYNAAQTQSSGQTIYSDKQFASKQPNLNNQYHSRGYSKTVVGVFASKMNAEKAVEELRRKGFTDEEINIVVKDEHNRGRYGQDDITDGALTGGTIGGIGGLILGAGALAIPGIGPIIAAGPIAAALGGAVAGGIAGGLIDWGIPAEASRQYERNVAEGRTLALIRTNSNKVDQAAQILRQNGAKDVESHS